MKYSHPPFHLKLQKLMKTFIITIVYSSFLFSVWIPTVSGNFLAEFFPKEDDLVITLMEGGNYSNGTVIHRFSGRDLDGDSLTFVLKGDQSIQEQFKLVRVSDSASDLVLRRELDRELVSEYIIDITLIDGSSKQTSQETLLIIVEDANDNSPIFNPFDSNITVPENTHVPFLILSLEADDPDEGPNANVTFSLSVETGEEDTFTLVRGGHGKISVYLIKSFDFETKALYQINITAKDNPLSDENSLNSTAIVTINVQDLNDNLPFFNELPNNVTEIREDIPCGSTVFKVHAKDGDAQSNSTIFYELRSEQEKFAINESTGVVVTKMWFNRDNSPIVGVYLLLIRATELVQKEELGKVVYRNLTPPAYVEALINVRILDVEECPQFRNESYRGTVPENSPVGYPVQLENGLISEVYDNDKNGKSLIKLRIEGEDGMFDVTPSYGYGRFLFQFIVKNNKRLDYETLQEIEFHLIAEDSEGNSTVSVCSVFITDVNDNVPLFSVDSYYVVIRENPKPGLALVNISASDRDSGSYGQDGIRYTKLTGLASEELEMDYNTGCIKVKAVNDSTVFDREQHSKIFMTVEVQDNRGDGNRNSTSLIIELNDENDNAPRFSQSLYVTEVYENLEGVTLPLKLIATDADQPGTNNSYVQFTCYLGWEVHLEQPWIQVDPNTNYLQVLQHFNIEKLAETYPSIGGPGISKIPLNFTVEAYDMGVPRQTTSVNLTLVVVDENDCFPLFENTYLEVTVPENVNPSSEIIRILASDHDLSTAYKKIYYNLLDEFENTFQICPISGTITLSPGKSFNQYQYIVKVMAEDQGGLKSEQACIVNVTVKEINHQTPYFLHPESLSSSNDFQGETCGSNISNPAYYSAIAAENSLPGTTIFNIKASDPDASAELKYSLFYSTAKAFKNGKQVNEYFDCKQYIHIDQATGKVSTGQVPIDYEFFDKMIIILGVEDIASETGLQSTTALLFIDVVNAHDGQVKFLEESYFVKILENSEKGMDVLHVKAVGDISGQIQYSIFPPNNPVGVNASVTKLPFYIEADTGIIRVLGTIDRELTEWINFTVAAKNKLTPDNLVSTALVTVQVEDVNDNAPIITNDLNNIVNVKENIEVGSVITRVNAIDIDKGDYGKVSYFVENSSDARLFFQINSDSGIVTLLQRLDFEKEDRHELVINVVDNFNGNNYQISHEILHTISIQVEDVNDEIPEIELWPMNDSRVTYDKGMNQFNVQDDMGDEEIFIFSTFDGDEAYTPNSKVSISLEQLDKEGTTVSVFTLFRYDEYNGDDTLWCVAFNDSAKVPIENYILQIKAEDDGQPKLGSVRNISINIIAASKEKNKNYGKIFGTISPGNPKGTAILNLPKFLYGIMANAEYVINSPLKFYWKGFPSKETLIPTEIGSNPFRIDPSGKVLLNFAISKQLRGYFEMNVTVSSAAENKSELLFLKIFIIAENQKLTFQCSSDISKQEAEAEIEAFDFELRSLIGLDSVVSLYPPQNERENYIFKISMILSDEPLSFEEVTDLFTNIKDELAPLFKKFKMMPISPVNGDTKTILSPLNNPWGVEIADANILYLHYALGVILFIFSFSLSYILGKCYLIVNKWLTSGVQGTMQTQTQEINVGVAEREKIIFNLKENSDGDEDAGDESHC